jgi:tRNA pseudouridine32 synthase / 23S rRNA pseudouridine746 synthase
MIDNYFALLDYDAGVPVSFPSPFATVPHPISIAAAKQLQRRLIQGIEGHDFRIGSTDYAVNSGKMFGVLVVKDNAGRLGYLSAFSGKLAGKACLPGFVPPIADILSEGSFYRIGEAEISKINDEIQQLETSAVYTGLKHQHLLAETEGSGKLHAMKLQMKEAKKERDIKRKLSEGKPGYQSVCAELAKESIRYQDLYKKLKTEIDSNNNICASRLAQLDNEIARLRELRRQMSGALQQELFVRYSFLCNSGRPKALNDIFYPAQPPAGAGDCAGPKLLQFAFASNLQPIAMAEFWWGQLPKSEIRRHGNFYPSCRGKCLPILSYMLAGLSDLAPAAACPVTTKSLNVLYEDKWLIAIEKPAGMLSVPGKIDGYSVQDYLRANWPENVNPLLLHRLDMSTSGILMAAKTENSHYILQQQFMQRTLKKRYCAVVEGVPASKTGIIDLPLRADIYDRPRQLVCTEHGKPSITHWEKIGAKSGQARLNMYPVTGRTHQLRVHAAHPLGLDMPIAGDDIYGTKAERLLLHAEWISFCHPESGKNIEIYCAAPF